MRSLLFDSMTYLQQKLRFRIRVEVRVRVEDPCLERTGRQMARSKGKTAGPRLSAPPGAHLPLVWLSPGHRGSTMPQSSMCGAPVRTFTCTEPVHIQGTVQKAN